MSDLTVPRSVIDVVLAELPMDGLTGHVVDCGYDDNDERCGCYTLPARIDAVLSAHFVAGVR